MTLNIFKKSEKKNYIQEFSAIEKSWKVSANNLIEKKAKEHLI